MNETLVLSRSQLGPHPNPNLTPKPDQNANQNQDPNLMTLNFVLGLQTQ